MVIQRYHVYFSRLNRFLVQPNPVAMPSQQLPPAAAAGTAANADAWQQYYQQYW